VLAGERSGVDVLTKPFGLEELVARIDSLLGQLTGPQPGQPVES